MNTNIFILPRQSGKSTSAFLQFLQEPESTLLVLMNNKLKSSLPKSHHNIISISDLNKPGTLFNKQIKNIILDEYYFYKNKEKEFAYSIFASLSINNLTILSSADKFYYLDFINELKSLDSFSRSTLINELIKSKGITKIEQFKVDYLYNPMNIPNSNIYINPLQFHNKNYNDLKHILSDENFKLEIQCDINNPLIYQNYK